MLRRAMSFAILVLLSTAPILPLVAQAAGPIPTIVPTDCNNTGGCPSICSLAELAQNLLNAAVYLAVFASAMWFIVTGFMFLTAQMRGETHDMIAAKRRFSNVLIGLLCVIGAWLVVDAIIGIIVTGHMQSPWYQLCNGGGYYQIAPTQGG